MTNEQEYQRRTTEAADAEQAMERVEAKNEPWDVVDQVWWVSGSRAARRRFLRVLRKGDKRWGPV